MNSMFNILKAKPMFIPKILLSNYKKLGLSDEELIIVIVIMNYGDNVLYNPELFASDIGGDKHKVMMVIDNLCDKNILSLIVDRSNKKTHEYLSLETLYEKLFNIILDKPEDDKIDNSIFSIFENELGRTLSPMEYEKIKEWITSGNSIELIACALNEAVMNGVSNLNYIDSILNNWHKKGYKTKADIQKEKENYRNKKEKKDIYDTDWLNG